jgi:hypothetical protein
MFKKIFSILVIITFISVFSNYTLSEDKKDVQIKKEPALQQIKTKKPVRIKLKRTVDGKYTWDLTGDDVDEVIKIDKRLKKLLNIE